MMYLHILATVLGIPYLVFAQGTGTEFTFEIIMHGVVGFFGAVSVVIFVRGLLTYLTRLGTERREDGIKIMQTGVTIMVVVVLCAGIVYWIQQ